MVLSPHVPHPSWGRIEELSRPPADALHAHKLCVQRGARPVIVDLELRVGIGEVLAVRGPSGVGKSSLLAVLCGLLAPASGTVAALGHELTTMSDRDRSALRLSSFGLVFQSDELLPELSVAENVTLPLRLGPRRQRPRDYDGLAAPVLERLGIADLADRQLDEISGGQLQRAAIARAVVHRPPVILADEPTENLDPEAAAAAMRLLIDLAREQGSTVVVVTHDPVVAAACDRQLVLGSPALQESLGG